MLWGGLAFTGARTVMTCGTEMDYCSYVAWIFFPFYIFLLFRKSNLNGCFYSHEIELERAAWPGRGGSATTWSGQNSCPRLNGFPLSPNQMSIYDKIPLYPLLTCHIYLDCKCLRPGTVSHRVFILCTARGGLLALLGCHRIVLHTVNNAEIHAQWNTKSICYLILLCNKFWPWFSSAIEKSLRLVPRKAESRHCITY